MIVFFVLNTMEQQLLSTGAFEVTLNGKLLKLILWCTSSFIFIDNLTALVHKSREG